MKIEMEKREAELKQQAEKEHEKRNTIEEENVSIKS
jgi:hypothetical protein